jgi:hypothetical protein
LPGGEQGALRATDAKLVFDGTNWLSFASSVQWNDSTAHSKRCATNSTSFAYVPYRIGPTPGQLGDCWDGDALPGGPGAWAEQTFTADGGPVSAPTLVKFATNYWAMFYTARKANANGQRCIGMSISDKPFGSGWIPANEVRCAPAQDLSATDPEIFFDRADSKWYLLWREDTTPCASEIRVQEFKPFDPEPSNPNVNAGLFGAMRTILQSTFAPLKFDEFSKTGCTGAAQRIESPAMVRAENNQLWLFFSANNRASKNYATGWAVCGTGSPITSTCGVVNLFDGQHHRPQWGASNRTAPVSGANAKPYASFPNITKGFGGLSLAVADPTSTGKQPIYATAQMYDESAQANTQSVLRLDSSDTVPALFEPEVFAWHGTPGSMSAFTRATQSGHAVSTRDVPGYQWSSGTTGVFTDVMPSNGLVFSPGLDHRQIFFHPTMLGASVGAYDPKTAQWFNIKLKTSATQGTGSGHETIPSAPAADAQGRPYFNPSLLAGAAVGDVQIIDGGNAVAFTVPLGYPLGYTALNSANVPSPPSQGIWPTFGIISNVNGEWRVRNQWTGRELAKSNLPRSKDACLPHPGQLPVYGADDYESSCQTPNEMTELPASRDIIVNQFLGGGAFSQGFMALRYTRQADGQYTIKVMGSYKYPAVFNPANPADRISMQPKEVSADPSTRVMCGAQACDERFVVSFDQWRGPGLGVRHKPDVIQEFKYNSSSGEITPASPPIIAHVDGELGGHRYDRDGNLWAMGSGLVMYAKIDGQRKISSTLPVSQGGCGFVSGKPLNDYRTTNSAGQLVWGQLCPPDYEVLQGQQAGKGYNVFRLGEDPFPSTTTPASNTVVGLSVSTAQTLPIRYSGTGRNMTFTIGNLANSGWGAVPGGHATRPGSFDRTGRIWNSVGGFPPEPPPPAPFPNLANTSHWQIATDVEQLFAPPPVVLSSNPSTVNNANLSFVQAENTIPSALTPPTSAGTIKVDPPTLVVTSGDPINNPADELVGDTLGGHQVGVVEYGVWVPSAGCYTVHYRVLAPAGGTVELGADGAARVSTTLAVTTDRNTLRPGPTSFSLSKGRHRLQLRFAAASGGRLDWIRFTRKNTCP